MTNYGFIGDTLVLPNSFVPDCGGWSTFTPTVTLVGGAGNTVPVYTTNSGRYCKIAKMVFVEALLDGDGGNEGAGTGIINIALPVTSGANKINGDNQVMCGNQFNGSGTELLFGIVGQSVNTIQLKKQTGIRNTDPFTGDDQNNITRGIRLHFCYEVD